MKWDVAKREMKEEQSSSWWGNTKQRNQTNQRIFDCWPNEIRVVLVLQAH
jgi:hypothetical protein